MEFDSSSNELWSFEWDHFLCEFRFLKQCPTCPDWFGHNSELDVANIAQPRIHINDITTHLHTKNKVRSSMLAMKWVWHLNIDQIPKPKSACQSRARSSELVHQNLLPVDMPTVNPSSHHHTNLQHRSTNWVALTSNWNCRLNPAVQSCGLQKSASHFKARISKLVCPNLLPFGVIIDDPLRHHHTNFQHRSSILTRVISRRNSVRSQALPPCKILTW